MKNLFDTVAERLDRDDQRWPDQKGTYHATCPFCGKAHKRGQTHFSVFQSEKGFAYKCHVCGSGGTLFWLSQQLGIELHHSSHLETIYQYRDETNTLLYEAIRYEPGPNGAKKGFYQRLPTGEKRLGNVRRVPYKLPDIINLKPTILYFVEGEKDVNQLWLLGCAATCNVGGAGKWRHEYATLLKPYFDTAIIIPDNDTVGKNHATDVAASLRKAGCTAHIVELPGLPEKGDVSDWLSAGNSIAQLLELVDTTPMWEPEPEKQATNKHNDRDKLTEIDGNPVYLPNGYFLSQDGIWTSSNRGVKPFYTGKIYVSAIGRDLQSNNEHATVCWDGIGASNQIVISRADLATKNGCQKVLGGRGAAIHAGNAQEMSIYLTEFIQTNYHQLPQITYTDKLGIIGEGLVLPSGTIGLREHINYTGNPIEIGRDHTAYPRLLREIGTWNNTMALYLTLGIALASPSLARLRPDRNPVLYLAGKSGSGKTTSINLGLGAFGDPRRMTVQCGSGTTTAKGMSQALARFNGIPVFFEDVHMAMARRNSDLVSGVVYDFGNRQLRSYGTLDQKGGGGHELGGSLMMAAEIIPEFVHAGQQNRVFTLDCSKYLPIGAPPRSIEGTKRATLIKNAVAGYGLFGYAVCERIWNNWQQWEAEVAELACDHKLADMHAWALLIAAAAVTIKIAYKIAGIPDSDSPHPTLLAHAWADMYKTGQVIHDPAMESFDRLLMMLSQSEKEKDDKWEYLTYERKLIASKLHSDTYWRVWTTSPQFQSIVGKGIIEQFGDMWVEKNLVLKHKNNKVSDRVKTGRGAAQCILIEKEHVFCNM